MTTTKFWGHELQILKELSAPRRKLPWRIGKSNNSIKKYLGEYKTYCKNLWEHLLISVLKQKQIALNMLFGWMVGLKL